MLIFVGVVLALTACDGYIEEARVQQDGTVEFAARATVVCTDELQQAIWDGDPCDTIDRAIRTGEFGELPFGFELDPNRVSIVGSGEQDRRIVDATWSGTAEDMSTPLVSGGKVRVVDEFLTEVTFDPTGTPLDQLRASDEPAIVDELRRTRWDPAQFRINVPDLVVEHNGDEIKGRIVIWDLDEDRPDEFRVVWTTEEPARRVWWWIVGSVIFTVIMIMMITLESPAQGQAKSGSD